MPMHQRTSARLPGAQGRKTVVKTNTFEIDFPKENFSHYDVLLRTPAMDRREAATKTEDDNSKPKPPPHRYALEIMDFLQTHVDPASFNPRGAYDGQSNLFLWRPRIGPGRKWTFNMPKDSDRSHTVELKRVAEIKTDVLQDLVRGIEKPHSEIALAAVNVVVRMIPIQKNPFYTKKSFFKAMQARSIGGGLELAEGWFQSVRPAIGKMLVNLDTTSTVMYKRGPLIEVCLDFIGGTRAGIDVRTALSPNSKQMQPRLSELNRFLKGRKVWNSEPHPHAGRKTKSGRRRENIIEEMLPVGAVDYFFSQKEGRRISIRDYFAGQGVKLKFPSIICAKLRSKTPGMTVIMPIELLELVPGQMFKRRTPPEAATQMIKMTQAKPAERLQNIRQGYQFMDYHGDYVRQTGMSVQDYPTQADARILDHPRILYGGRLMPDGRTIDRNLEAVDVRDGSWNMLRKRLLRPATIKAWAFLVFDHKYVHESPSTIFGKFAAPLQDALRLLGMNVLTTPFITSGNSQGDIPRILDSVYDETMARAKQEAPQLEIQPNEVLFIAILNNPNVGVRDAFKRWGDITRGVPTQVVVGMKTLNARDGNSLNQYCNNLALKINGKLGGINSTITNSWFSEQPTMIIGADVSHPAPESKMPSISAFVFTHDRRSCSDYLALSAVQEPRLEKINDLSGMFKFALRRFDSTARAELQEMGRTPDPNRKYIPKRIVIYRDGVSEGEFKSIYKEELGAIMKSFEELREPPSKITFVVVGKRHHIRLFPSDGQPADRNGNCMSGTVVDTNIVHPVYDDFYLQSQKGLIGTSRSGHYTLLHDDNGLSADVLQRLSFDLCHTFARSTSSVSIPAPVYYADLVCARGRYHFDPEIYGSESGGSGDGVSLSEFKRRYSNIHAALTKRMYFL